MKLEPLLDALEESVREACTGTERVGIAFSGGLDSTVIATLARDVVDVRTYTVGYPRYRDMINAEEASTLLGLPWVPLPLDDRLLLREARGLLRRFPSLDPVTFSFELPLWILLRASEDSVILAGQGADELFGGYAKYEGLSGRELERDLESDLKGLMEATLPREEKMARERGKELRLPYCTARFASFVTSLPLEVRVGPRRKELLRRIAERLGLPKVLVERPKKAVQYGSGVMKRLRTLARREGEGVEDFLRGLCQAR